MTLRTLLYCTTLLRLAAFSLLVFLPASALAFTDISASLEGVRISSVAWGDYDNDGDLDILLTGRKGIGADISHICRNDAGLFTDIMAGLEGAAISSVAWGDYDNDGDLDVLLSGLDRVYGGPTPYYTRISRIYRNDAGLFTDIRAGLEGVSVSSVAWGDYDNDGDLDILLTGQISNTAGISRIYRNDVGAFTDIGAGLQEVLHSSVAWGDYDNDGDLDVLLTGYDAPPLVEISRISRIYRNDVGAFTDIGAGLQGVSSSSVAWGDYDNDGDLDILLTGNGASNTGISRIYRNDAGMFTDIGAGLEGVYSSSVAWGDYDNDGDLDILLTGYGASYTGISRIYRNDAGVFTDIGAGLEGVYSSSVAWGDYDNDGDLDILLTGDGASSTGISRIYRNDRNTPNIPPNTPKNLSQSVLGTVATLSWSAANDAETPAAGLTYNLRVGTAPGSGDVFSGMVDPTTGYRRVVQLGNANHNLSWDIEFPGLGTYYWSVQAIDTAFEGGPFAEEQAVVVDQLVKNQPVPPVVTYNTRLMAAVPNPFNPRTVIAFELERAGNASLQVFDVAGRLIETLVDGHREPGPYEVEWDGRDYSGQQVAAGVYFYRLQADYVRETRRMVLVK